MKLMKNCTLVDKDTLKKLEVLISDEGYILKVDEKIENNSYEVIDCKNKYLMPALTDLHVHFRDPGYTYKEDLVSGSRAAISGGYTTVNMMANTNPIVDNKSIYDEILNRAKKITYLDMYQALSVTENFDDEKLSDFSIESCRIYSNDGVSIENDYTMYEAIKEAKKYNKYIFSHLGNVRLSKLDYRLAEDIMAIRDINLCENLAYGVHFSHISTKKTMENIIRAKDSNISISCGVTPHHISLYDNDYKVNPPIKRKEDVDYIIEAIKKDYVDIIETDHAPHSIEDKKNGAVGLINLETAFMVCYTSLVKNNGLDIRKLSKLMSYNPNKILGIEKKKGLIKKGYEADLILVDLDEKVVVDTKNMKSKSKNTPFENMSFYGKILFTMKKGEIVYDNR
ncbi:dihydroorotase [Oceanivirga miroungae]|uniref:Allantoinase n=1 Tax=Oceanivirga miroungae TaxID=1130046 RepID=A0A6I8MEJ3_9FUSO|nr:dihydroorotase [Oceanivirga miroungae]VWL85514.1 allantoinase [Oceanivirga miroungae]